MKKIYKAAQFVFDKNTQSVKCKCGFNAVYFKTGYLCGTITAYPCKYNFKNHAPTGDKK